MVRFASSLRRRRLSLALGTSALACGILFPAMAQAQCAPDPTIAGGTTTCTGTDSDGFRITSPGSTLTVSTGATVTNSGVAAVTVEVPNTTSPILATIAVSGQISGGAQSGIALLTGPVSTYNGSTTRLTLRVDQGAAVSGTSALTMGRTAGNLYGQLIADVDNAGTLSGTSGVALRGDVAITQNGYTSTSSAFGSIVNRATGVISGSIIGPVASLANAGLIDGGSNSAVAPGDAGTSYPYTISPGAWTNTGTIRSNSAAATIIASTINRLTNSGTIANGGTGAALTSSYLDIRNETGGQISSGGATAIAGTNYVRLVNAGTITGDIVTGNSGSVVDSSLGRINGSVVFGSGNDTLVVGYDTTSSTLVTGITGSINAGGGTNTEQIKIAADATINTPFTPLSGFQRLLLDPGADVTVTLGSGFSSNTALALSGVGTVVNRGTITTTGTALTDINYAFGSKASFRNEGAITATLSGGQAAVTLQNDKFFNSGSVTANGGGGVSMSYNDFNNSGMITASGTGVDMFDGVLTNSGTIVSTAGAGVSLHGNVGYTASNSGTIHGATAGAVTRIYLTNSGTISSPGVGVQVQPYGYLINLAGGVVNGGSGGAVTVSSFNAGVANAGTINGDVSLSGFGTGNNLTYFALAGGTLNGNLRLTGATLVTDLVNTGTGSFAGIAGAVTADSSSSLRYAVNADAVATLGSGNVGPFNNVGYQLANGAKLTLTTPATQTASQTLLLAGSGTVDLNVNIATSATSAIQSTSALSYPGSPGASSALSITSRGAISVTRPTGDSGYAATNGVSLNGADSFTNLGTITVTDRNTNAYATGISGGTSITNAGTIQLDGGIGIGGGYGHPQIVNTGSIAQIAGGATATGISGAFDLDNRGSISVGGTAVLVSNNAKIINSGTIASTGGIAIGGVGTGLSAAITNAAGGTIVGTGGTAVRLYYGTFTNAGTVTGSVDMGYGFPYYSGAPSRSYASSVFVAAGGTVAGDLRFGDGDDLLLQTAETLGVSGTIDGGAGINIYGRSLSSSGTVALSPDGLAGFQDRLIQALGRDTVVTTATGTLSGNLYALGTGNVVNQATIAGRLVTSLPSNLNNPLGGAPFFSADDVLASLTNAGSIGGGVQGTVSAFTNKGTIGSTGNYVSTVSLYNGTSLTFTNSGTIAPLAAPYVYQPSVLLSGGSRLVADNSGTIGGGLYAEVWGAGTSPVDIAFANSGSITGTDLIPAVQVGVFNSGGGVAKIDNSGTISADGAGAGGLRVAAAYANAAVGYTISNSGTIAANATGTNATGSGTAFALEINSYAFTGTLPNALSGTVNNAAGGKIAAEGDIAVGIAVIDGALDLTNAGTISALGRTAAYAVWGDGLDDRVTNTGTITGAIVLGAGADTIDNAGTINGAVSLGDGDDSFLQRGGGRVSGTIDGGDGANSFTVSGGTADGPAMFGDIRNFQRFAQSAGFARIGGTAAFGTIELTGGRLIGDAGSVITAPQITVGQGATFGSAGVVNGNITVAGTLSPGASPGTMTVNGNVALGSTSTSVFELSSTVADRLVVNGAVSIASGATLQLVPIGDLRPGASYTLITASGGITGSYTNVLQPSDPIGIFVLRGNEIDVIGAFHDTAATAPQVSRSIAYLNATLAAQPSTSTLFDALSTLVTADGVSNPQAFARLTPEPYAAAVQMHIDNALTLSAATRGGGFAASGDAPHVFTFGATLGDWHRLSGDAATGTSAARSRSYGLLGGIGFGDADWSVGAFGGYLNNHQYLDTLAARTKADGAVAGVQGRMRTADGFAFGASILYSASQARTSRTLPVGTSSGRYDLHSWAIDATVARELVLAGGWAVRPELGISYVRTVRDRVAETGGSPFALTLGSDRHVAGFGDGAVSFGRSAESAAAVRPFVSLGMRYQIQGERTDALGGYAGGDLDLYALGPARARLVGTAAAGVTYRLQHGIDLFATAASQTGDGDHRESASGGVRIRF